jgi:CTP:molybdopterin cytidylyltransferase MocA
MGSPKALLEYRGETFLNRLIRVMGAVCDPVIVVLGYHAEAIRAQVRGRATIIVNPEPERGQLSSLQTGLAAFLSLVPPAEAEGFAFIPMDCPAVREETVRALAETFRNRDAETLFVIPRLGDKRGHPVLGTRRIAEELMALPLETGAARDVVHAHVARTRYVDVDDAGILTDVDDPAAYRRLLETAI